MVAVNIRDFPNDLHRESKVQAAKDGITLKDLIIEALNEYLQRQRRKGG